MKEYENLAKKLGVFMSFSIFTVDFSEKIFEDYKFSEDDFVIVGDNITREFDSWISEKSTCRSHKTCFFCVKFLVFIYCILLQCVVKYNKGGILHASYYIEI